jgi:CRISPR-associated protein Cas8a1/Csx13
VDEREVRLEFQGYSGFKHQGKWKEVAQALTKGSIMLASWVYPGAVERHIGLRVTKKEYTAIEALCACFALVGCLSYKVPQVRGGALVTLAPSDLVRFAELRPILTAQKVEEVSVAGASDAVLAVQLALRMESRRRQHRALDTAEAFTLRTLPWASQLKSRSGVLHSESVSEEVLDRYETVSRELPNRLRVVLPKDKGGKERKGKASAKPSPAGFFVASSVLRAFITENLAAGRPWYEGFATAIVTIDNKRRFIHHYRAQDNLGALLSEERKGLIAMLQHLEDAERTLVESVHVALRQRFGAIAKENQGNPVARRKRMTAERDRWRLAFAGAKTSEQVRAALADLWSRAGSNSALQAHWRDVLPLLRQEHWRAARDLALVALASYQGQSAETFEEVENVEEESLPSETE